MEHNDDIEQLLQQYGRRQQLASQVRHLAHAQARRRMWVASTLLVLIGSVGIIHLVSSPQSIRQPLVAQQLRPVVYNTVPNSDEIAVEVHPRPALTHSSVSLCQADSSPNTGEQPDSTVLVVSSITNPKELSDSVFPITNIYPKAEEDGCQEAAVEEYATLLPLNTKPSGRLHLISSVTASAMPFSSTGYTMEGPESQSNSPTNNNSSTLSPRFALTADVGASFTVAEGKRRHLDIGLALGGHYHQGEILNVSQSQMLGIDGNLAEIVTSRREDIYNIFSLYASLPLTFNVAPKDRQHVGWSLTLIPARRIAISQSPDGFDLNPWRLTLGVGMLLPTKFPRRVSLVGNLLPLYTSQSVHEIGIEIGF